MKKLVALILSMCFLLAACGSPSGAEQNEINATDTVEENTQADTSPQSDDEDVMEDTTEGVSTQTTSGNVATFGVPPQDFIDVMNVYLSDSDIVNAFDQKVEPTTMDDGTIAFSYPITNGSTVILYEDPGTNELTHVYVNIQSDKLADTADAELVGSYLAIITACFSTDQDDLDALDAALQIVETGFSGEAINLYNNRIASFAYIVSDGIASLSVLPPM